MSYLELPTETWFTHPLETTGTQLVKTAEYRDQFPPPATFIWTFLARFGSLALVLRSRRLLTVEEPLG